MKIYITGPTGSGKSYLAKKISKKLKIPYFECDSILYEKDLKSIYGNRKKTEQEVQDILKEILSRASWIIEGVPRKQFCQVFDDAEKIIILDIPKYKLYFRVIYRWVKQRVGYEKSNYIPRVKMLLKMIAWVHSYEEKIPYPEKHIIVNEYYKKDIYKQLKNKKMDKNKMD